MTSDLFKGAKHAQMYAKFRPYPPENLVKQIIYYLEDTMKTNPPFNKTIDIGCGSGQSTVALSPYFTSILGLDASENQIKCAKEINALNNIEYKISDCQVLPVFSASIELVTLCQAIHWFNKPDDLYKEIHRVLAPNGVIAVYGYLTSVPITKDEKQNGKIRELIEQYLHEEKLGTYWAKEKYSLLNQYRDLSFPFKDFQRTTFIKESDSSLSDYMGYLSTWSSYQKLMKENPENAKELLEEIEKRLKVILQTIDSSEKVRLTIHTDYFLLMGHI